MMTAASATALSSWILREHPGVFATILKGQARRAGQKLSGLGDDFDDLQPVDVTAQYIGDPNELTDVDVTAQYINDPLQPVQVTAQLIQPSDLTAVNISTPSLVSTLGSSIGSAVSSVASFLLKGTAVIAPVAVAAFNAKTSSTNAQNQQAVLAAQIARAGAGIAPANISYLADGTPVYIPTASATGGLTTIPAGLGAAVTLPNGQTGYTLTSQALNNLAPSFLQKYGVYILGGGALLAAAFLFS